MNISLNPFIWIVVGVTVLFGLKVGAWVAFIGGTLGFLSYMIDEMTKKG